MSKIAVRALHQEVAQEIRELIRKGLLQQGQKIGEREFCARLGISRTPLREALRVLSSEGLIDLVPHRGAFVTRPSVREIRDMFEVMSALEGLCARHAAQNLTDEKLLRLERLHEALEKGYRERDEEQYIQANHAYHQFVQALAENHTLNGIVNGLRQKILLYRYRQLYGPDRFDRSIEEHRALLEAFRRRDAEGAEALMKHHLHRQCEALVDLYRTESDEPAEPSAGARAHSTTREEKEATMSRSRRSVSLAVAALALGLGATALAPSPAPARELRISHQFSEADARNKLAETFAKAVEEKTNGDLTFKIFPSSALFKAKAQYDAMAKGALDLSVFPLAYADGKVPQLDITLMPCIITSVKEGMAWRNKPIGKKVEKLCEDKGMKILTWLWYAGGIGSNGKPVVMPDDVKGLKFRAAGKLFEYMLHEAGASITSMPSSELYMALQTKVLDAGLTSAESFVSYRLYEQLQYFNTPEDYSIWFMAEPLVMGMRTWNSLTPEQQKVVTQVGLDLEKQATETAIEANTIATKVFQENDVQVHKMTKDEWQAWEDLARKTAWKHFAETVSGGQEFLDLAKQ